MWQVIPAKKQHRWKQRKARCFHPSLEEMEGRILLSVSIVDLGNPPDHSNYAPGAINDNGQVIGNATNLVSKPEDPPGFPDSYLYTAGSFTNYLIRGNGVLYSQYVSLNNSGQAVGSYYGGAVTNSIGIRYDGSPDSDGIVDGHPLEMGLVYGWGAGTGINASGVAVGTADGYQWDAKAGKTVGDEQTHATIWNAGTQNPTYLPIPGISYGKGINDAGTIVGYYVTDGGNNQAFVDLTGSIINLSALPGDTSTTATGISNDGDVIGTSGNTGVIWKFDVKKGIYNAPESIGFTPLEINDSSVVLGSGVVWTEQAGKLDLNQLLSSQDPNSGWSISTSVGINSSNQITGIGSHNGVTTAYIVSGLKLEATTRIVPSPLKWDKVNGGVDFGYQVNGSPVKDDTQISLYWSPTQTYDRNTATPIPGTNQIIPRGTAAGTYGPFNESSNLIGAPEGTKYLLAVTDPNNVLGNFDPAANVQSLQLVLPVQPVYQNQGPWAPHTSPGYLLGHSTTDNIEKYGCALTDLVMALNYEGIPTNPIDLNNMLTVSSNGYDGSDTLNWGPATAIAAGAAGDFTIHFNWKDNGSSDPQDLRDLLTSNAAPVIVSVDNPHANGTVSQHFVLVTGIDGNTFTINDPGYPSGTRATLAFYGNDFTIVGSVTDPPSDISALYFATAATGAGSNLLVTDPQGRVTGLPSGNGQPLHQIPNSIYFVEGPIENLDGPSLDNTTAQFVYISTPGSGKYSIQTSGTTSLSELEVSYGRPSGGLQSQQVIGQALAGQQQYQVDLDPSHTLGILSATISDLSSTVHIPTGSLSLFGLGFGPGFQLDAFEIDTSGQVFSQPFGLFGLLGTPIYVNSDVFLSDIALVDNQLLAFLSTSNSQPYPTLIVNFSNPYVLSAILNTFLNSKTN